MVRFLVVRFSSIGDIILTSPVLRHLKRQVEDAEIHYLTKSEFTNLLEANPHVDRIHAFNGNMKACIRTLRKERIDYIIDLHHNARSTRLKFGLRRMDFTVRKLNLHKWLLVNLKLDRMPDLHMVDRNLETIRTFIAERDHLGLDYFIPEKDHLPVSTLPEPFNKGYIAMAIGAKHETKKLPDPSILNLFRKLDHPVVLLGGPEDRDKGEIFAGARTGIPVLNLCGECNFNQSASLVRQCRVLITHDTGLMHVGAAYKKQIVSIWGNTVPAFGMVPYRSAPGSALFEVQGLSCRPCSKIGYRKCPRKHFRCMLDQDLDGIAATANRLFYSTDS